MFDIGVIYVDCLSGRWLRCVSWDVGGRPWWLEVSLCAAADLQSSQGPGWTKQFLSSLSSLSSVWPSGERSEPPHKLQRDCWLIAVRGARRMLTVRPGQTSAVLTWPRWTAGGNPAAPPSSLSSSRTTSTIWPRPSDTNWTPPSPQCPRSSWTWWCARACSTPWWRAWAAVRCSWRQLPGYNNCHRLTSALVSPPPSLSSQSFVSQLWQHTWLQYNGRQYRLHCNSIIVISRASDSGSRKNNPNSKYWVSIFVDMSYVHSCGEI